MSKKIFKSLVILAAIVTIVTALLQSLSVLNVSLPEFFEEYYPYKEVVSSRVQIWQKQNPRTLEVDSIKKKIYYRLAKNKERKNMPLEVIETLQEKFVETFECAYKNANSEGCISAEFYEAYVMPLMYDIKKGMHGELNESARKRMVEGIFKKEYSVHDIAELCDISYEHLIRCINGKMDFNKMNVIAALKLCFVLDLNLTEVFAEK